MLLSLTVTIDKGSTSPACDFGVMEWWSNGKKINTHYSCTPLRQLGQSLCVRRRFLPPSVRSDLLMKAATGLRLTGNMGAGFELVTADVPMANT